LVETPKPPRSLFTTESLREFLNKTNQTTSLQLCHRLLGELSKPAIKADDDITLVIVKHTGGIMQPLLGSFLLPAEVEEFGCAGGLRA
jgi:hypothetical protein